MGSRTKRCCTSCCGLLTFLAGLAYLLLKLALFILCFTPSVPRQTLTCRDASEMTFFTVIDVFQITLLLTSGCLGMLTCTHRAKMDSILVGYFVLSSIAFFTSSISLVQSSVELFKLGRNRFDQQTTEEQSDVINDETPLASIALM
ncbi:uncharacterized protein [Ptychodera flava]|uniref:uncharacterized protein n=1 Tax=Ptychodera flava TaxID=63121 RepID=UPI00396A8C39